MRRRLPPDYPFVAAWVLASAIGIAVSGAFAGRLAASGGEMAITLAPSVADGIRQYGPATMAAMSTLGAGLGVMQWIVVRGRLEGARWWAPATVGGWGVAGAVIGTMVGTLNGRMTAGAHDAGLIGVVITVSLSLAALGLIPATFQWLILRGGLRSWARYSLRHAAGLVTGGAALWALATSLGLNLPSGSAWAVGGIAMGACIGAATARPVAQPLRLARDSSVP
jgi:hypothetical protein